VGNGRHQCLSMKAPVTRVLKSGRGVVSWGNEGGGDVASFSIQRRWSGVARGRLLVAAGVLWFGAGGGRRRPVGSVAGAFTKRKCIPRKEWANAVKKEEGGRWGRVGQKDNRGRLGW
jgi:hypothetical protein